MKIILENGEDFEFEVGDDSYSLEIQEGAILIHKNSGATPISVENSKVDVGYGQTCYSTTLK